MTDNATKNGRGPATTGQEDETHETLFPPADFENGTKDVYPGDEDELDPQDSQCGWGSCRPGWLQPCANMKLFTLVLAMINMFGSMNFSYYTAVITQIEKCFGLSSTMTGFVKNVDNIGYMMTVLIISHFCRYADKPKLFSIATVFTAIAIFMFGLPHFIYGAGNIEEPGSGGGGNGTLGSASKTNLTRFEMCDGVDELDDSGCSSRSYLSPLNVGALAIFVASELLQGMAQSPKFTLSITYMDDNAKKNSPIYYGFLMGMRSFSPVLGFMLGAWCTSIYVDLSDTDLDPKDPRWVGAWWLGFIICGLCSLVWVFPLSLFPPVLPGESATGYRKPSQRNAKGDLKDLPQALWRLVTNPILIANICGACFNVFLIGYATFKPKYLEMHFGMTAAKASVATGIISMCSFSLGPIVSGMIVSRMKVTPTRALTLVVIIHVISVSGFILLMFLGCPQGEWAGTVNLEDGVDVLMSCNNNCSCDPYVFAPVCGSNNINYFSSCYAGCQAMQLNGTEKLFTGCSCIPGGIAYEGQCDKGCTMIYPYMAVVVITQFAASMSSVPIMTVNMRSVAEKDKALSLALFGCAIMVLSFPAPMLYGYIVDGACLVSQSSCTRKGACLLYDSDRFRYLLHGVTACIKACALVVYILALLWSRNNDKKEAAKKAAAVTIQPDTKEEQNEMLPVAS